MGPRCAIVILAACGRIGFTPIDQLGTTGTPVNLAFVTSSMQAAADFGGLAGGDAVCATRAAAAGLPGTYRAWLSTSTIDAIDRLAGARGWRRIDGTPVADLPSDLIDGRMLSAIRLDETGADVGDLTAIVTGTYSDGTALETCSDYTDPSANVTTGTASASDGWWTNVDTLGCATPAPLYCFGIDLDVPLGVSPATGRLAFVSTAKFTPSSGLAAADETCASEAAAAGLAGEFLALLPASGPAEGRFDPTGPPWIRVDGLPLAPSADAFFAGNTRTPLDVAATGGHIVDYVLTGGAPNDAPDPTLDCAGWTSSSGNSVYGFSAESGVEAFNNTTAGCATAQPVYCLAR